MGFKVTFSIFIGFLLFWGKSTPCFFFFGGGVGNFFFLKPKTGQKQPTPLYFF